MSSADSISDDAGSRTVGEAVLYELAGHGADTAFGMPGTHSLELYRAMVESGIRHIGVRHEQGAGFMADGYARASGRPAVCLVIGGPGVTNASTAIGEAYADSIPMLVLSNAIDSAHIGMDRNMVHELADQRATTSAITSLSTIALKPEQAISSIRRAFAMFASSRPRPVHVSIPIDVLKLPSPTLRQASRPPELPTASRDSVARAFAILARAKRPIILAGGGAVDASGPLSAFIEALRIPVVTTTAGKGIIPDDHPLSLGSALLSTRMLQTLCSADVVFAIGTEIGEADLFETAEMEADQSSDAVRIVDGVLPLRGQLLRLDIDAKALSDGRYQVDAPLLGDARRTLDELLKFARQDKGDSTWTKAEIQEIRLAARKNLSALQKKHVAVLDQVRSVLPRDAMMVADLAQINTTSQSHFPTYTPRSFFMPLGFSTLGYALPAAIGAMVGCPGRACIAVVGDGGLMFTLSELATAIELRLPLPILLWNNQSLGEIRDYMQARGIPQVSVSPHNPDFMQLAQAFGCDAVRPQSLAEVAAAVTDALRKDGPTLIEIAEDAPFLQDL